VIIRLTIITLIITFVFASVGQCLMYHEEIEIKKGKVSLLRASIDEVWARCDARYLKIIQNDKKALKEQHEFMEWNKRNGPER
jgi:hypothetical protein